MLIVTNFARFPKEWAADNGTVGRSVEEHTADGFIRHAKDGDAVFVVNCDPRLVTNIALRQLFRLGPRRPLVAVDLVLRRPAGLPSWLRAQGKRILFQRVDYFLHYFKDTRGIDAIYGIGGKRCDFVPFKANIWDQRPPTPDPEGEYVICFGRSLRDYDTFFLAMERLEVPGAIVDPQRSSVWQHGSRFTRSLADLPLNVRVLEDDLTNASQAALLRRARVVVVPIVPGSLVASGISTILNAMLLGKCVVASAGPGVTDVFTSELLSVPPGEPDALADTIYRAWTDDSLRRRTAEAGWEYAQRCGSEQDLFRRIIDRVTLRFCRPGR